MTTTDPTREHTIAADSIVVATDGSDDADRAVHWAAEQAFLERRPLTVVSTVHGPEVPSAGWGGMGGYTYDPTQMLASARAVAQEAADVAHHLHPGLTVAVDARIGDPRQILVEISRDVHMVVMGSRGRGSLRSKLLGSVSAAVSRDAGCPVVVCRPQRHEERARQGILVGADGTAESLPVIEFAFQQASLMDLPLTVVHAVWDEIGAAHGPVMVSPRETGLDEYRLLLGESVAGISSKFPEVEVDLRLARGMAEDCLSDTSPMWNLIVVGRHPVDSLLRLVTGAVATSVVERSHTTVAVVPQADAPAES
ncbi:universal stress protein [Nocardioides daeguensis]|uniref:Universal stress protein n=1 Tax=Nocardioides daeguensis TaxID=908359 RepID=A0ABP6UTH3_9ACTN|nr:universal stress protein [Nocardioides daeguensis]MBV6728335.1 universal stress protein [Nocardioides daeguensis]MCR1773144.1 universal stress protein [Nocardioides daeguensis]